MTDTMAAKTPMSDHVARFWQTLETEHVRILIDIKRDSGGIPYWDAASFGDDVAKALVAERRALSPPEPTEGQIEAVARALCRQTTLRHLRFSGEKFTVDFLRNVDDRSWRNYVDDANAVLRALPLQQRVRDIPVCAITGLIAGDADACGDCDPCGTASVVPDAVKRLLAEKEEWRQKYGESAAERDAMVAEQQTTEAKS